MLSLYCFAKIMLLNNALNKYLTVSNSRNISKNNVGLKTNSEQLLNKMVVSIMLA